MIIIHVTYKYIKIRRITGYRLIYIQERGIKRALT